MICFLNFNDLLLPFIKVSPIYSLLNKVTSLKMLTEMIVTNYLFEKFVEINQRLGYAEVATKMITLFENVSI